METKSNRQWLIAIVAALIGLFLGLLCGAVGGATIGYLLGRGSAPGPAVPEGPQRVQTVGPVAPQPQRPLVPTVELLPDVPGRMMGALVLEVVPGTPAERAGLRPGDIILAVDGQEVGPEQPLTALIQRRRPGERVLLSVRRAGSETLRIDVQLVESPTNPGRGYLGVRVQNLSP